jgi:hypothetical protein
MGRKVSLTELKRLFYDIRDRRPDVRIRLRVLGKMWNEAFCSIDSIKEDGITLVDTHHSKYIHLNQLSDVVQFELECPFFGYHAFYHYEILNTNDSLERTVNQPVF